MTEELINYAGLDGIDRLLPKERRHYVTTTKTISEQRLLGCTTHN